MKDKIVGRTKKVGGGGKMLKPIKATKFIKEEAEEKVRRRWSP